MKNNHNFFNWQGNNLHWESYFPAIFVSIAIVLIISLVLAKDLIYNRFQSHKKILWFDSHIMFWRFIGVIGFIFMTFRLIMFTSTKYPLYWTNLWMHLCRIHVMVVFSLMIVGKFKWIKYITYVSIAGSFLGLGFAKESDTLITKYYNSGKSWEEVLKLNPSYHNTALSTLLYKGGYSFYNVGFDNWWLYDFLLAHLSIIFFPLFITFAYKNNLKAKELTYMQMGYLSMTFFMWSLNFATKYTGDLHWMMNNWYIGPEPANDQLNAIGWVTGWPQNLFTYMSIGFSVSFVFHGLLMYLDKFQFFVNNKFVTVSKSGLWKEFKEERAVGFKQYYKNLFKKTRKN